MLDWLKIAAILLYLFATSVAEGKGSEKHKVYLNFWTFNEGELELVNLTDPMVIGTCLDGFTPVNGTQICGKEVTFLAQMDPVWFPDTVPKQLDLQYEMDKDGNVHSFVLVGSFQSELRMKSFGPDPASDPLGELEYRFMAVLQIKNFGDGIIEVTRQEPNAPFPVEGRNPPMLVNIGLVIEQRSQPRAQL